MRDADVLPIRVRRERSGFVPVSAFDAERLDKYAFGAELEVKVSQKRSLPRLRLYWAILHAAVDATGRWATAENLSDELKMACGFHEPRRKLGGSYYLAPQSIAFSHMDEAAFAKFFDDAMMALSDAIGMDAMNFVKDAPDARHAPSSPEPDTNEAAGTSPDRQEATGDNSPASELSTADAGETDGIDPDAPSSEHEDAGARGASEGDGVEAPPQSEADGVARLRLCEAAQKLLEITTASDLDPKGMQETVAVALPGWKDHVGAENHPRLQKIVKRVNDVISGKNNLAAAVALISAELGAKTADVDPAKGGRRG